jgi:TM2 domain-containing membrane protein YozV
MAYNQGQSITHLKEAVMQSTTQIQPSSPPKDPVIAAVLSLILAGGAGQIYLGQQKKGIILIVAAVVLYCAFGIGLIVNLIGAYDAYVIATKLKGGKAVGDMEFFWQASAA